MPKKILSNIYLQGLIVFLTAFFYLIIWIWQGIDLTDSGMNLTKQWLVFNGYTYDYLDMLFGSYFIGGLWNNIIPGNYLIWAYIGSAIIGSLSLLLVFLIIREHFDNKTTMISSFIIIPLLLVPVIKVPNYNDIPTLVFLFSFYFFNRSIVSRNTKKYYIFILISGFIFSFAVLSRFMLVVFLIFPIPLIIYNLFNKKNRISWWKDYLYFILGFIIGAILISIILYTRGLLFRYTRVIYENVFLGFLSDNPDLAPLTFTHSLESTIIYNLKYLYYPLITMPFVFLVLFYIAKIKKVKKIILQLIILSIIIISVTYFFYKYLGIFGYYNYLYYIIFGFNIFVIILFFCEFRSKPLTYITLLILFSQFVVNFGSLVMNWTNMYLSTVLVLVLLLKDNRFKIIKKGFFLNWLKIKKTLIIFLIIFGILTNFSNVYRDSENRFKLNKQFQTRNLTFVFSSKSRVEAIDGIIKEIKKYTRPKDMVLLTNNIPMLYYLTETIPVTREPWALNLYTLEALKNELNKSFNDNPPEIIVIAKGSPRRDREWPKNVETVTEHERNEEKLTFINQLIKENNYRLFYENKGFRLFKK